MSLFSRLDKLEAAMRGCDGGGPFDRPRICRRFNAADQQLALVVDFDQWTTTVGAGVGLVSSQAGQFTFPLPRDLPPMPASSA